MAQNAHRVRPLLDRRTGLTTQRVALITLGVKSNRIHVDHGLTGMNELTPA